MPAHAVIRHSERRVAPIVGAGHCGCRGSRFGPSRGPQAELDSKPLASFFRVVYRFRRRHDQCRQRLPSLGCLRSCRMKVTDNYAVRRLRQ